MSSRLVSHAPLPFTVLILGGTGFIGRHAAGALLQRGHRVVIGTRRPGRRGRRPADAVDHCERRETHLERLLEPCDWSALLEGVDAVVNCVGILRQRGPERYEAVHCRAPVALAAACAERTLRLVHVSALGLQAGRSRFLRSKRHGEQGVLASSADAVVVRPSLLDGDGGFGARWLRRVANWPLHPHPADARGRIALMSVIDLGECLARLTLAPAGHFAPGRERIVELGGPHAVRIEAVLHGLRTRAGVPPRIAVPGSLVRLAAHLCDLLHVTPLSFGHYELLQRDNAPARNAAPRWLGRAPSTVGRRNRTPPTEASTFVTRLPTAR